MKCPKISPSKVIQYVAADCWDYFEDLGADEVRHYMKGFPKEPDYNLVNYGNMRIYYAEVRELFERAGLRGVTDTYKRGRASKGVEPGDYKLSDSDLWEFYRHIAGRAARVFAEEA